MSVCNCFGQTLQIIGADTTVQLTKTDVENINVDYRLYDACKIINASLKFIISEKDSVILDEKKINANNALKSTSFEMQVERDKKYFRKLKRTIFVQKLLVVGEAILVVVLVVRK